MKKKIFLSFILLSVAMVSTGCGNKTVEKGSSDDGQEGQSITSKDVVSQKDDVVDGQEITRYELKDGSSIELPRDVDLDNDNIEVVPENGGTDGSSVE